MSEGLLHSHVGRGTFVMTRPASTSGMALPLTVGFVLRDLSSPFFSLIAHAAQQRADALGVGLLFASSSNRADREEEQIRRLKLLGVHGLIIVSMSRTYRPNETIQSLTESGFPYTMVSWTAGDDVPFVGLDYADAGLLAARHLLSLGRRRMAYVIDSVGSLNGELRMGRFRETVAAGGYPVDPAFVFEYPNRGEQNDYESGYAIGERMARLANRPDAVFVFNDLGALGLEDALLDAGVDVPREISIVGLDDIELAERARVPLTTVKQPVTEIGTRALDTVLARYRGEFPPIRQLLPPELVVRASCGARSRVASGPPPPARVANL